MKLQVSIAYNWGKTIAYSIGLEQTKGLNQGLTKALRNSCQAQV